MGKVLKRRDISGHSRRFSYILQIIAELFSESKAEAYNKVSVTRMGMLLKRGNPAVLYEQDTAIVSAIIDELKHKREFQAAAKNISVKDISEASKKVYKKYFDNTEKRIVKKRVDNIKDRKKTISKNQEKILNSKKHRFINFRRIENADSIEE